jgi:hypothetical protein|uniref:Uncharacterized protein n=1 Tax=Eutreptiella gymnastica TaxID=73025 RepID=A0A7S4FRC1_9EUGL
MPKHQGKCLSSDASAFVPSVPDNSNNKQKLVNNSPTKEQKVVSGSSLAIHRPMLVRQRLSSTHSVMAFPMVPHGHKFFSAKQAMQGVPSIFLNNSVFFLRH